MISFAARPGGRVRHALALLLAFPAWLTAQDGGPGTGGMARLAQVERALTSSYRVLVIGAHPDDEDTELITILSRGLGIETAYLSLTRGEGGQNLIGDELGAGLGIVRTEELLAARRIDGGQQFFTRAIDFGFSTSADETLRIWSRDSVLADIVRIIRRFRPDVIVSVWSGTPDDGHGHHQASGMLAREAFDAAQDSTRFPMAGLAAWRPRKFYRDYRASGPGETFAGGVLDRITGHSYRQLAARSRSQHRSQDMGGLEEVGPSARRIVLEAVAEGLALASDTALLAGLPARDPARPALQAEAQRIQLGLVFDAYTTDQEVVPGQAVPLTLVAWNAGQDTVSVRFGWDPGEAGRFELPAVPACLAIPTMVVPGEVARCLVPLRVRSDASPDAPYFLRAMPVGGLYTWSGDATTWGDAFAPPLTATFEVARGTLSLGTERITLTARRLDQGLGELRLPVAIVPRVMLRIAPDNLLWPVALPRRTFEVEVAHGADDTTRAQVQLAVPAGWGVTPPQSVSLAGAGDRRTLRFEVTRPAGRDTDPVVLRALATVGPDSFAIGRQRITYPHITTRQLLHPADVRVVPADVRFVVAQRIGYVRGAADRIPEALAAAGIAVTVLAPADLGAAELDRFDVMVVGPRAYEVEPALGRAHARLLAWARRGGTLITQYQQYQYLQGGFPPHPLTIGRPHDRVTDEASPVTLLDPSHPAWRAPNVLTPADFAGWIQERGLYFARTWDAVWTPLLEMRDPGELPVRGGLLVAPLGRGIVVYTGIAFFRQLPAAVPGAWKLFANLLALRGTP